MQHCESEHEGLIVASGRHLFLIENGRRVWVSKPPPEAMPDFLAPSTRKPRP